MVKCKGIHPLRVKYSQRSQESTTTSLTVEQWQLPKEITEYQQSIVTLP